MKVSFVSADTDLTGEVGIGNPNKSGLGLTVHQSGDAESGISIYATGGSDAVLNLMENNSIFGHPNNGGTGFRCMYDGGTNQFLIRSADDDTVNTRLSIERDSGAVIVGPLTTGPLIVNASRVNFANLPTSDSGLSVGDLWRDSNYNVKVSLGI